MSPGAPTSKRSPAGRRFGYVVAIACNAVMLYVANHLLDWGWPRFLTEDFEDVLPIVSLTYAASMVAYALFIVVDAQWLRSPCDTATSAISFAATLATYQVFPFDFSSYARDWAPLCRGVLLLAMIGTAIATIAHLVEGVRSLSPRGQHSGRLA